MQGLAAGKRYHLSLLPEDITAKSGYSFLIYINPEDAPRRLWTNKDIVLKEGVVEQTEKSECSIGQATRPESRNLPLN